MGLPLWDPLREAARTAMSDAGDRIMTAFVTAALTGTAAGLVLSAGLVALSHKIGFPLAAALTGTVSAGLALIVHLAGRARAKQRAKRILSATDRAAADLALASRLGRSARPLTLLAAFLGAFLLTRRG